uniref:Uncharacterized protein n=1 Tax=Trichobilharzia regenti TaxID=157069 RepID=A0AA85KFI7_TRIRE|nr:unnamed protein product [Trichobilharzia regenti]
MLVTLGLGSSIGATESFLTAVCDEITIFNINKKKYFREGLTFGFLSISFLLSIPNACQGGYYLVQYLDQYTCGTSLLVVSLFQCFAIVYVYGIYNLSVNLQRQTGQKIYFTTRFILKFCVPLLILFMLVFNFITADILETSVGGHVYTFPRWSLTTSWFVLLAGLLPIPINMICQYCFVRKRAKQEQEQVLKEGVCPRLKWKHWLKI